MMTCFLRFALQKYVLLRKLQTFFYFFYISLDIFLSKGALNRLNRQMG